MFKKFLLVFVVALSLVVMTACGDDTDPVVDERTYKADGVYTAFAAEIHKGTNPQMTSVTVTIENDEIKSFFIDVKQSFVSAKDDADVATKYEFNEKSKKELGYAYGMHNGDDADNSYTRQDLSTQAGLDAYKDYLETTGKKEWFEQAELLEAYFVENDPTSITVDETSKAINNVAGVTVKDGGYSELAAEALQLAKEGKAQVVVATGANIVWATATVNEDGEFTDLELNTLQGKVTDGAFAWNEKSKQELGYLYGMHNKDNAEASYTKQDLTTQAGLDAYKAYLSDNSKLEWFEQADLLTDYVLENGLDGFVVADNNKLDKDASNAALASVSVTVSEYHELLEELFANFE